MSTKIIVKNGEKLEVNAKGGAQSHIGTRMDLLDGKTILRLGRVLHEGAEKYSPNNWRKIPRDSHINHAIAHLMTYLSNEGNLEEELDHAFCRVMMGIAVGK